MGEIKKLEMHYDAQGQSMGIVDVLFLQRSVAMKCLEKFNDVPLDGRKMRLGPYYYTSIVSIPIFTYIPSHPFSHMFTLNSHHFHRYYSVQLTDEIQRAANASGSHMGMPMTRSMQSNNNNNNNVMMNNPKAALFGQALGVFEGEGGGYNGGGGGYDMGHQQVVRRQRNMQPKQPPTTRVIKLQEVGLDIFIKCWCCVREQNSSFTYITTTTTNKSIDSVLS